MKDENPIPAQTQRLASLGFMLASVCHEVSNPLAAVSSMLQILQSKRGVTPETLEKGLASIAANVARVAAITKKLGDYSRVGGGAPALLAIDDAVDAAAALLRHSPAAQGVRLDYRGAPGVKVLVRPGELEQVVFNIFLNAAQAMQGTGSIEAHAQPDGAQVVLSIRDRGPGIAPENLARVFDPFFTTKGPEQGTGLGLSTTLGIVKSHAGFVRIDSALGRGTTVDLYLPAAGAEPAVRRQSAGAERTASGGGELVLVIDDEAMIRHMMRALLDRLGYRPLVASGGTEAMAAVAEHGAAIRWVICDLQMPGLDGVTLLRALVPKLPAARLVVMSGVFDDERNAELTQLGVRRRLEKPFDRAGLLDALRLDEA